MNIKNVENLDFDVDYIVEKIEVEFEIVKENILEVLANENNQLESYVCMDREDGHIYTFWDCGNTCVSDIVLYCECGQSADHSCCDCPLCEENIRDISEKWDIDAEEMTARELKKLSENFDDWFDDDVENLDKTVEELRHQCYVEYTIEDSWESFKMDMIEDILEEYPETVEKIVANGGFQ